MKQKSVCLVAAALLLAALTACTSTAENGSRSSAADGSDSAVTGELKTDPATGTRYTGEVADRVVRYGNGYGNTNADKSLHPPTALQNGSADVTGTVKDAVKDTAKDAEARVESAADTAAQKAAERTSYQKMLENARVRDTDGFLRDGENAAYRTLP